MKSGTRYNYNVQFTAIMGDEDQKIQYFTCVICQYD